jgi:hypothetical protein
MGCQSDWILWLSHEQHFRLDNVRDLTGFIEHDDVFCRQDRHPEEMAVAPAGASPPRLPYIQFRQDDSDFFF